MATANVHELPPVACDLALRTAQTRGEIEAIRRALLQTDWNRNQAAQVLKTSRQLLESAKLHWPTTLFVA